MNKARLFAARAAAAGVRLLSAAIASGPVVVRDGLGLGGAGMVAWGAHQVYGPAGWIVGGVLLMAAALRLARAAA